jgi:hypothetical protein
MSISFMDGVFEPAVSDTKSIGNRRLHIITAFAFARIVVDVDVGAIWNFQLNADKVGSPVKCRCVGFVMTTCAEVMCSAICSSFSNSSIDRVRMGDAIKGNLDRSLHW